MTAITVAGPVAATTHKRYVRAKLAAAEAWLEECRRGTATFPLTRWGRPDYGSISQTTMGTKGSNLKPGHPVRRAIDAHWEQIRHDVDPSETAQSPIHFGAGLVAGDGVSGSNGCPDTYALTNFDAARLHGVMPSIGEALLVGRTTAERSNSASYAWWRAFDAWRGIRDASGFGSWLQQLMGTPSGRSGGILPQYVLGLLRRNGFLLLPLGLVTGTVPHPCSTWGWTDWAKFPLSVLTEWEQSALLSDKKQTRTVLILLTITPVSGTSEFPREAFVAAVGTALSRTGAAERGRSALISRAFELAGRLDHQAALVPGRPDAASRSDPTLDAMKQDLGLKQQSRETSLREALDRHLREAGLRGVSYDGAEHLRRLSGGPAGEWASLLLRYINAQRWKAPTSRLSVAKVIVEGMSLMSEVPRLDDPDLRAHLIERSDSFCGRWQELTDCSDFVLRDALSTLRQAMDWHAQSTPSFRNPLFKSDIPPKGRLTKSNKTLLPRDIIEEAKGICRELMSLAWAEAEDLPSTLLGQRWRELLMVKVAVPGRGLVSMVSPVLPTLLYSLLSIPIRGIQARLLDSGEADEVIPVLREGDGPTSSRTEWIRNGHPLARAKRRQGSVRRIHDTPSNTHLLGLWINTNKTTAQGRGLAEDHGFEIPWQHEELIEALIRLRDWQSTHNPVDRLLSRAQLSEPTLRPTEALKKHMPFYSYLFRHLRDGAPSCRLEPVRERPLVKVFLNVLEEMELRRKGTPGQVKLIIDRYGGAPKTALYSIHGLRVSGITGFVEAGVPPPIIAEFLAGHLTVLMTLYYTKLGPAKVTDILERAMAARCVDGRNGTIGGSGFDAVRRTLIGDFPSAAAGLVDANPAHYSVKLDGICPNGQSRCHEGGEDPMSRTPIPTPGGPRNCPLCRFWTTGEAFLPGQVVSMNAHLYAIREKGEALVASYVQLRATAVDSPRRHAIANAVDTMEAEMDVMVRTLQARYRLALKSLERSAAREAGDARPAILGNSPDAFTALTEVSELRFLAAVSKAYEFLPETSTPSAPIRRNVVLDRLLHRDGIDAGLFRLPADQAVRAGGLLTEFLCELTGGEEGLDDLDAGRTSLEMFGIERVERGLSSALAPVLAVGLAGAHQGGPLLRSIA